MSLTTYDLPTVFICAVELAQATIAYRPEDYPHVSSEAQNLNPDGSENWSDEDGHHAAKLRWHGALDGIVRTSNRLKVALGATGSLDVGDQLVQKIEPAWEAFQNQFKYVSHALETRQALWKLANAAVDLSGYATVLEPEARLRERGLRLLSEGLAQLWSKLNDGERAAVRPLLPKSNAALGWPPNPEGDPPVYDGPQELTESTNLRVIDIGGGFATRSADFFEQKEVALAKVFPAESAHRPPSAPKDSSLPHIFECAVKYAVVIWDKKSEVTSDGDPFDCVPDFSEIGVARFHLSVALGIPNHTVEGWKEAVRKAELSDQVRQALVNLNKAEEWEHLPRDDRGNRSQGSLATAFGLLQIGIRELYLALSQQDQESVKQLLLLIRERWERGFPSTKDKKDPIPKEEANILVRKHLRKSPGATIKKIQEATGVSTGAISQSVAWQAHQAAKIIRKNQAGGQPKTIHLNRKILQALGQSADPRDSIPAEEIAWRNLLEQATPEERARLYSLNPKERAERIQALLDQVSDQSADEKDDS